MMEKNVEARVKELVLLKITDQLSEEQNKELDELRKISGVDLFIDRMTKEYLVNEMGIIKKFDERKSQVWDVMRPGIEFRRRVLTMWQKVAIAASFVLVVSVCSYLFLFTENKGGELSKIATNDSHEIFAPDNGKAILTLANGTSVLLDTAQNGLLVQQGGISVRKTDGQVQYVDLGKNEELVYNKISTPIGGGYSLVLQDGTRVILNTGSSLKYPTAFVGSERKVEVTGEAYFEVAENKLKPFIVTTNDVEIRVLGTRFNVNAYANNPSINTTLFTGSVKIVSPKGEALLKPGQQAIASTETLRTTNKINLDVVAAWRSNQFYFSQTPIAEVMQEVARWYGLDVVFEKDLKVMMVGRMDRTISVNEVIKIFNELKVANFSIQGRKIIVSSIER